MADSVIDSPDEQFIAYITAQGGQGLGDDDRRVVNPSSMDITSNRSEPDLQDTSHFDQTFLKTQ